MTEQTARYAATNKIQEYQNRQWKLIAILAVGTVGLTFTPIVAAIATIAGMFWIIAS